MKTFKEFAEYCDELQESSSGESGRRRLSSRGPSANRFDRNKQRQDSSNRAALSKAGFSRSSKPVTGKGGRKIKYTETSASTHHDTETSTYANQSDYAAAKIGNLGPKGNKPTSKRALQAKQIRKQLGGDRTPRPVHDVIVSKKRTYDDDDSGTMTKGRSFRKEVTKGVSANLKKAGAKPGDIMTSKPTSDSRSRMYAKTHNAVTNKRTGTTANRITKESYLLEKAKTFSSREEGEKHHGGTPEGYYWNNAEFVEETYITEGQSREEAEKKRLAKDNPDEWRVRKVGRAGEESWTTKRKDSLSQQGKRRRSRLNPLTQKELESHANRNLRPNAKELAAIAYDREEDAMEKQENAARRQSRKKKVKHVQDHSQPLQQDKRRPENKERFERVTPGHVASNLQVTSEPKNLAKGSKPPKKGERGYGTTRSGAVKNRLDKAQKFSDKMDRLIASIRKNK